MAPAYEIRADHDARTIVVHRAYAPTIAGPAPAVVVRADARVQWDPERSPRGAALTTTASRSASAGA
ncbi:hypothetical protein [Streptomyces sp. NBC_01803]|uniref:hypothetical protein n=1 Tax=Streptomyces sp. NBC_01803 TaxID=2975946 RepID=UPI002DD8EA28|nr:hypothetical protein [Streptomyces sp. NBC_01803]